MNKMVIIGAAVVLLGGGGAAAFFLMPGDEPPVGEDGAAAVVEEVIADPIYRPLSPNFVINFKRKGTINYLQLSLQVMARDQEVIDKVELNDPAIRNRLIMLFSGQDYDALGTQEGKEALRAAALVAVNETIELTPEAGVQEVFFTGFVMQ
ncbi:MAG: flagellar basal body-associated protein FliL [Halioglobus sp.]